MRLPTSRLLAVLGLVATLIAGPAARAAELLNVSFDIARELYSDVNTAFRAQWKASTGEDLEIRQSHGGSSKQARAVLDGLAADVVTLNQAIDLDALAARSLVSPQWRTQWPHGGAPYASTIVFLVRRGNPRNLRDWPDLVKPGISVVVPNPKTSGNGRYSYLAAYAHALKREGRDEAGAREFVAALFRNVPILDTGGRAATTTFVQREIGDVLLTFEAEALLTLKELGSEKIEVVRPPFSVDAEMPVAIVERQAQRKGNLDRARAYLQFLYSEPGQEIIARHGFRPRLDSVLARHAAAFGSLQLFRVEETLGPWAEVQKAHFAEGGHFDRIYERAR